MLLASQLLDLECTLSGELWSVKMAETVWSETLLSATDAVWLEGEKYCRWLLRTWACLMPFRYMIEDWILISLLSVPACISFHHSLSKRDSRCLSLLFDLV